ncbi:MAG: hypothetical protein GX896_03865, partial [Clostridiales bacterium]|nr:hypothetical protein [Clostridiales bacterium]
FKTSFSLVALFNIAVILVITAINMCISNNSFNIIGRFIKWLAKAFFSLFARFKGENVVNETVTTAFVEQDTSVGDTLIANNSHSSGTNIGTLIFNAFQIVIYIGLVIGILFIIYTFIKQYMHRNTETKDEIKDTNDVINKININKKPSASKPSFFGTNKDKIRKIFVAKVHSSTKKNNSIIIKKSYTSDEIENALLKEASVEKTNMNKLTSLYKEARYSNHEITKSDVEEAKKVSTWLE